MVGSLWGVLVGRSLCYILVLVAVPNLSAELALHPWFVLHLRG